MRRAVFSLWTGTPRYKLERNHALLFSASVAYAAKVFPEVEVVTDVEGLFVADRLGWAATSFTLDLEGFCPKGLEHIFMLGKLRAQRIQTKPFVHVDLDAMIMSPLPLRLAKAPVWAQSKDEPFVYMKPLERRIIEACGISKCAPYNTGLIGWSDMGFMQDYCKESMRLCELLAPTFNGPSCSWPVSAICEQMLLACMARERGIKVEEAIPIPSQSHPEDMADFKFAHFWSNTKNNPYWIAKIEAAFARNCPQEYQKFIFGWDRMEKSRKGEYPSYSYPYGTYPVGEARAGY